jgi:hypothetical protein
MTDSENTDRTINIPATVQQWQALLQLLNQGLVSGAYDLTMVSAVSFWANHIEQSGKAQEEQSK